MQYSDVIPVFFDPATADNPAPVVMADATPARQLRDAFEPIAMHAVWSPLVHERLSAQGLDFFGTYAWGRACVMGEPSASVVASAFAAFEPGMIGAVYDQARQTISRDQVLTMTFGATATSLRSVLGEGDLPAIEQVGSRLAGVVDSLDATGRPLFSGVKSVPSGSDPFGQLWQATLALREHRGDAHIAAYIGEGFNPTEMNILTELWLGYPLGEYSGSRAWSEEATAAALDSLRAKGLVDGDAITAKGREVRDAIEDRTDAMEQGVIDALGSDIASTVEHLSAWSQQCVAGNTFPPDPRKRAAG